MFPSAITHFWHRRFLVGEPLYHDDTFTLCEDPALAHDQRAMLLNTCDGRSMAVLTPTLARQLALQHRPLRAQADLRQALAQAGVRLHGADRVFHFSELAVQALLQEPEPDDGLRPLGAQDQALFQAFRGAAPAQELDEAYVELDHWLVYGAFAQGPLVSAASLYPWDETREIVDLGVITLPAWRGHGHARRVVRAICRHALARGYQPQYRCQLDNVASSALARAAGLTLFGTWEVVSPEA